MSNIRELAMSPTPLWLSRAVWFAGAAAGHFALLKAGGKASFVPSASWWLLVSLGGLLIGRLLQLMGFDLWKMDQQFGALRLPTFLRPLGYAMQSFFFGVWVWAIVILCEGLTCLIFFLVIAKSLVNSGLALASTMAGSSRKTAALIMLVIPQRHREEIIGDFNESVASAERYGRTGKLIVVVLKVLLYAWVVLRLRIGDLTKGNDRRPIE